MTAVGGVERLLALDANEGDVQAAETLHDRVEALHLRIVLWQKTNHVIIIVERQADCG